ncbi:response regulator [Scytonema sp. UIC 10036]|uniref:response regulator n=1 Tax=Scytonema sp. UIC 10036 TaxID=2304196 RepID=UPI0012DA1406|nr:response regulator [Scytonema sp. UIC 10036]
MIILETIQRVKIVSSEKILIVDDEEIIRLVVQSCLEDLAGWNVITAQSGQEALSKVMEEKPDAILLDVMMPGMTGLEFLRLLRENPKNQYIPVILLTAKSEYTTPQKIIDFGLAGAISKPFDAYELVENISNFLNWKPQIQ